jgi:hypothetical protein
MDEVILDLPASPPITELHVWIGHYAQGGEGLISADLPMPGDLGMRHMPLMNSSKRVAASLAPLARQAQSASQHVAARITRIELRTFRMVTG